MLDLYAAWSRFRNKIFSLLAARSFASFGARSVLQLPVRVLNPGRIAIGDGVFVGAGSWLQVLDDETTEGPVAAIEVGAGTSIAGNCTLSAAHLVRLGERVLLARGVYIADHGHRFDGAEAILDQGIADIRPIVIGDGAWLGQNAVVMPGVTIGAGAVIGANAVVTRDVPERTVAVGAPARVVRTIGQPG